MFRMFSIHIISVIVLLVAHVCVCDHSILSYGGIAGDSSNEAGWTNSAAFTKALVAANSSTTDRTVLIPSNNDFYIFEVEVSYMVNITITIDGNLYVSNNISAWPTSNSRHILASLYIGDSQGVTINGSGKFDGQGYEWWWYVIVSTIDNRPMLIAMERVSDIIIYDVTFKNSPQYHLDLRDIANAHIHDIDIIVDVTAQKKLLSEHGLLDELGIPTFPLNTDGIDPQGLFVCFLL